MKNIFYIIILSLGLTCCKKESKLEGIWYVAYYKIDDEPLKVPEKMLWEFSGNKYYNIQYGNLATGNHWAVTIDSSDFELKNTTLIYAGEKANIRFFKDSIIVIPEGTNKTIVLSKLNPKHKGQGFDTSELKGAFELRSKTFIDTIEFISDSLLIHTGEYNLNYPVSSWNTFEYKGYSFLNIHEIFMPLGLVQKFSENEAYLLFPPSNQPFSLLPINKVDLNTLLVGNWIEVNNSAPSPPLPIGMENGDQLYKLQFKPDTLLITRFNKTHNLKWNLTSNGKRIYFNDILFKSEGSWKVLQLTENQLKIRMSKYNGASEEIITFKKR